MAVKTIRRIAAELMKCGESRVILNPADSKKIEEALTREDVRSLIKSGAITRKPKKGVSRWRARMHREQKKKGRRRGPGSLKGKKFSRLPEKDAWMARVRAQRKLLKNLLMDGKIDSKSYRKSYRMVKGGAFKGKNQLLANMKEAGVIKA